MIDLGACRNRSRNLCLLTTALLTWAAALCTARSTNIQGITYWLQHDVSKNISILLYHFLRKWGWWRKRAVLNKRVKSKHSLCFPSLSSQFINSQIKSLPMLSPTPKSSFGNRSNHRRKLLFEMMCCLRSLPLWLPLYVIANQRGLLEQISPS